MAWMQGQPDVVVVGQKLKIRSAVFGDMVGKVIVRGTTPQVLIEKGKEAVVGRTISASLNLVTAWEVPEG